MFKKLKRVMKRILKKNTKSNTKNNTKTKEDIAPYAEKLAGRAGISRKEAEEILKKAEKTYGIPYKRFLSYGLIRQEESEWAHIFEEKEAERKAARRRKNLVKKHLKNTEEHEAASGTDKYPDPVIAACYYLGSPLPEGASTSKKLSEYIGELDGSLETIRERVGERYIPKTEQTEKDFEEFKRKYLFMEELDFDTTSLSVYYVDYCFHCKDYKFRNRDYFDFEFYKRETAERAKFISTIGYQKYVSKVCITDVNLSQNKAVFNRFFADFISRDWLDTTDCTFEQFREFASKHPVFFAKPVTGTGGHGAGTFDTTSRDLEECLAECRKSSDIIEEIVIQHPKLAEFNKDTLNTIRIYALADIDNNVHITGAFIRFGRAGKSVDNFHSGGMGAAVDPETGVVISDGVNLKGEKVAVHPDSGLAFKGFQVPEWDAVKKTVEAATRKCSDINRHVGWDIAIRENGKVELIEGNSRPNFDFLQAVDKIGKFDIYDKYLTPLAEAAGIKVFRQDLPDISTEGMTKA